MRPLGSQPIRYDNRDSRFTEIAFGAPTLPVFPKSLFRLRKKVKDQGGSLSCTAQATSLASEYQENVEFSAAWHWMETCRSLGNFVPNGADPRTAMSVSVKKGDLRAELAPYSFPKDDPQTVGNWNNWYIPESVTELFKKAAYIKIPFVHDYFDSVRAALLNGQSKGQVVLAFGTWYYEWGTAFVPKEYSSFAGYHAYTFIDFDTIEGTEYLVAQNSYGTSYGDGGFQYFPRATVNREFSKWGTGLYVFEDLTPEQILRAKETGIAGEIQRGILRIWESIMLYLNR